MPIRPVAVDDARAVTDLNVARRVVDMAPAIILLESDKKSLMTFLDSLGVRKVTNHSFNWLTDAHVPKTHEVGGAGVPDWDAGTDADLSGLSAEIYLRPKDIIRFHDTGELARVIAPITDMSAITTAQLERNVDGALPAATGAVPAGGLVTLIGSANEENSVLRDVNDQLNSVTTTTQDNFNVTQTFRDPVGLSRRELEAELYGGKDRPYQRMKKLLEHCQQIENAFWHSVRMTNGDFGPLKPDSTVTTTEGMLNAIRNRGVNPGDNTFNFAGALDEDTFNQVLRIFSRYGNTNKKVLFASRFVCEKISGFLRESNNSVYRLNESSGKGKKIGVEVTSYISGTGFEVDIVPTHALEGRGGAVIGNGNPAFNAPDVWDGLAAMIDPENVKCAKYGDTYMKLETDVQLPDQDGVVDSYISDVGLQWGMPEHHLLMEGINA